MPNLGAIGSNAIFCEFCDFMGPEAPIFRDPWRQWVITFHWLPVKYRVLFKIAVLTFKSIYGQSPEYLRELINIRSNTQYNLRSNNGLFLTFPTIKTMKTLGDRAFCVAAPTVWNNLPESILKEQDFKKFKSLLKTFLFKAAYNWLLLLIYLLLI